MRAKFLARVAMGMALSASVTALAAVPVQTENQTEVQTTAIAATTAEAGCSQLKEEIKNLKTAQSVLMKSLVQKNETLAETLDIFAKDVLGQKSSQRKSNSKKLKQAANSFRSHSIREQGLVDRFEALAQDLYSRIDECLVVKETSAKASSLSKTTAEQNQGPVTSQ